MKRKIVFGISALALVAGFIVASSLYRSQRAKKLGFMAQENASTFIKAHSPMLGDAAAKVYIVKFTDPACETCAAFSGFVKQWMAAYPGKIRLVIRYAPFHEGADTMVKILEAARRQGKYWETLQVMFDTQPHWASHHHPQPDKIWEFLPSAGLNMEEIRRDINNPRILEIIRQDVADAQTLGVHQTPAFFVNGKPLPSFGLAQLKALVDAEIAASYGR